MFHTKVVEKTHPLCSIEFFPENCAVYGMACLIWQTHADCWWRIL